VLVRRLEALETAASVDTAVFDKTGTLTHDRLGIAAVRTRRGVDAAQALALAGAIAKHSLHPVSRALAAAAGETLWKVCEVEETPGAGLRAAVTTGSNTGILRLGSAGFCEAPAVAQATTTQAMNVRAATAQVHLADAQGWLATFDLDESLRDDAREAVGELHAMQLQVQLLSGDASGAVQRLARRAGITHARGAQTPEDKLRHVIAQQAAGHRVLMAGDGMNDGPVLARADVSIAVGEGVPLAQGKSDFILLGGQLERIPMLLRGARRTRSIVRQNRCWAAGYNAVCVPLALAGLMPPWAAGLGMAASSLFVVLNAARLARIPEPAPAAARALEAGS
jgi:Cu2+-exporting ATPase